MVKKRRKKINWPIFKNIQNFFYCDLISFHFSLKLNFRKILDVFSYGMVLFELFAGKEPFQKKDDTEVF